MQDFECSARPRLISVTVRQSLSTQQPFPKQGQHLGSVGIGIHSAGGPYEPFIVGILQHHNSFACLFVDLCLRTAWVVKQFVQQRATIPLKC